MEILLLDPEVQLINISSPIEVSPPPSEAAQNEAALGSVDNPVPVVACLTYCGKRATHLRDLVDDLGVSALISLDFQPLLPHIGESSSARRDVVLASL